MWEYLAIEVSHNGFPGVDRYLNELGQEGWEAVGMTPVDWSNGETFNDPAAPTIGVLLKRRIPEP